MSPIKHILAPIDFSERSKTAVNEAAQLAEIFDADLTLLHVSPTVQVSSTYRSPAEIAKSEKTQLEASHVLEVELKAMAAAATPGAKGVLAEGDPAQCIEDFVEAHGVDLLVVATHGLGGFRRYLMGSLTSKLLHDLDVTIVTSAHLETAASAPSAMKNIGCAVDLRHPDDCKRILQWSGDLAKLFGAELTVIHVPPAVDDGMMFAGEVQDAVLDNAAKKVATLLEGLSLAADVVIQCGDPMDTVAKHVERKGCDALVIGRTVKEGPFRVGHADGYALIRHVNVPVFSI